MSQHTLWTRYIPDEREYIAFCYEKYKPYIEREPDLPPKEKDYWLSLKENIVYDRDEIQAN